MIRLKCIKKERLLDINRNFIKDNLEFFYNPPTYEESLNNYNNYLDNYKNLNNKIALFKMENGFIDQLKRDRKKYYKYEKYSRRIYSSGFMFSIIIIVFNIDDIINIMNFDYFYYLLYSFYIDLFIINNNNKIKHILYLNKISDKYKYNTKCLDKIVLNKIII